MKNDIRPLLGVAVTTAAANATDETFHTWAEVEVIVGRAADPNSSFTRIPAQLVAPPPGEITPPLLVHPAGVVP